MKMFASYIANMFLGFRGKHLNVTVMTLIFMKIRKMSELTIR